jgi:hypothetical protein
MVACWGGDGVRLWDLRRVWDWRHPGVAGEGIVDGGQDVGAVLGGGGDVAADGVPVAGDLFGAEPAGYFLLGLGGSQVAFGLVGGGRDAQVGGEPQHIVLPVAQAFQQVAAGPLLAAGHLGHLGQASQHAVPEVVDQRGGDVAGDDRQALGAGSVRLVDQPAQRVCDLAGPDRGGIAFGGIG